MMSSREYVQTTAGDLERESRSPRFNLVEGLGMMTLILFLLWGVAYPFGVMSGIDGAKQLSEMLLVAGAVYMLFIAPRLHRDTASSWGLGTPWSLWRLLRESPPGKRTGLVALLAVLFVGLNYLNYQNWDRVVKFFNLHHTPMPGWDEGFPGLIGLFAFGGALSFLILTFGIRYDNFLSAFTTAMKVALPLFLLILLGAIAQRGEHAFDNFGWRAFFIGVFGYVFWGFVQQLLFSAYLGTRIRKGFGPSAPTVATVTVGKRLLKTGMWALGCSLASAILLFLVLRNANSEPLPLSAIPWFMVFLVPLFAVYVWFFLPDPTRMLVATLSGSCFGMIHIDSYGLVAVTFLLGIILTYVFMEERNRNLVALGFIHGLLGSSFGLFFSKGDAGALEVDYSVGPWNVDDPTWPVMAFPVLCMIFYVAVIAWYIVKYQRNSTVAG